MAFVIICVLCFHNFQFAKTKTEMSKTKDNDEEKLLIAEILFVVEGEESYLCCEGRDECIWSEIKDQNH
jgi:hypothetical protein